MHFQVHSRVHFKHRFKRCRRVATPVPVLSPSPGSLSPCCNTRRSARGVVAPAPPARGGRQVGCNTRRSARARTRPSSPCTRATPAKSTASTCARGAVPARTTGTETACATTFAGRATRSVVFRSPPRSWRRVTCTVTLRRTRRVRWSPRPTAATSAAIPMTARTAMSPTSAVVSIPAFVSTSRHTARRPTVTTTAPTGCCDGPTTFVRIPTKVCALPPVRGLILS